MIPNSYRSGFKVIASTYEMPKLDHLGNVRDFPRFARVSSPRFRSLEYAPPCQGAGRSKMVHGQVTRDSKSLETPEVDLIHATSSPRQAVSKSAQGLALISEGESRVTHYL